MARHRPPHLWPWIFALFLLIAIVLAVLWAMRRPSAEDELERRRHELDRAEQQLDDAARALR